MFFKWYYICTTIYTYATKKPHISARTQVKHKCMPHKINNGRHLINEASLCKQRWICRTFLQSLWMIQLQLPMQYPELTAVTFNPPNTSYKKQNKGKPFKKEQKSQPHMKAKTQKLQTYLEIISKFLFNNWNLLPSIRRTQQLPPGESIRVRPTHCSTASNSTRMTLLPEDQMSDAWSNQRKRRQNQSIIAISALLALCRYLVTSHYITIVYTNTAAVLKLCMEDCSGNKFQMHKCFFLHEARSTVHDSPIAILIKQECP